MNDKIALAHTFYSVMNMRRNKYLQVYFFILILLFFVRPQTFGQDSQTSLEPNTIFIGQHAILSFEITYPDGSILLGGIPEEGIHQHIEILHHGAFDTISPPGSQSITLRRSIRITSWEEGFHAIPPIVFTAISGSDTLMIQTDPLLLEVMEFSIEEHTDLKDIRSILSVPLTWADLKYYIIGALLLIALIYLIIRYFRRPKKQPEPASVWHKPEVPAHVAALGSLETLKAKELWQKGKIKQYHIELTDIIRHYLEKRFHTAALEMTTAEIMLAMNSKDLTDDEKEILKAMLELADLVKFARYTADAPENESSMDMAFQFVNQTKMIENPIKETEGKPKNSENEKDTSQ